MTVTGGSPMVATSVTVRGAGVTSIVATSEPTAKSLSFTVTVTT